MTRQTNYQWRRFWTPRGDRIVVSDQGYLIDPQGTQGEILNPSVETYETALEDSCVILLGEPGIGKSQHFSEITAELQKGGNNGVYIDLKKYSTDSRLFDDLFGHPTLIEWLDSEQELDIFLDSFDECLIHVRTLVPILVDGFKDLPIGRLNLRIACRTTDWPEAFEDELNNLWGESNVTVYELAPLTEKDVKIAASSMGFDGDSFLSSVSQKNIGPFAARPVTLILLLRIYRDSPDLPKSTRELYEVGCLHLSRDPNKFKQASKTNGILSTDERFLLAQYLAAIATQSTKPLFCTEDYSDNDSCSTMQEMVNFLKDAGIELKISYEDAIIDLFSHSALFTGASPNVYTFSHWTFAEFLSARLLSSLMPNPWQILDLLVHPDSGDRPQIVPQLREVAAWISLSRSDVCKYIALNDPEVLLRGFASSTDDKTRESLIDALFELSEQQKIHDVRLGKRRDYSNLQHPSIARQLKTVMLGADYHRESKRIAISIVEESRVEELYEKLVEILLDPQEDIQLRKLAGYSLNRVGDFSSRSKIAELLNIAPIDDPDDEFLGHALRNLWPNQIDITQVLENLRPPQNTHFLGAYSIFLSHELAPCLEKRDLPIALEWAARNVAPLGEDSSFEPLIAEIIKLSLRYIEDENVLQPLSRVVLARMCSHKRILQGQNTYIEKGETDFSELVGDNRYSLIDAIAKNIDMSAEYTAPFLISIDKLLFPDDMPWLIQKFESEEEPSTRLIYAHLITEQFRPLEFGWQIDPVYSLCESDKEINELIGPYFRAIDLQSDDAKTLRAHYDRQKEYESKRPKTNPNASSLLKSKLENQLNEALSGNLEQWWLLNYTLQEKPDGTGRRGEEFNPDLDTLPSWTLIAEDNLEKMLAAATEYINSADPDSSSWFGTSTFHRPAAAGYRAIRLLLVYSPELYLKIDLSAWTKWIPTILAFPDFLDGERLDRTRMILKDGYRNNPAEFLRALQTLIDKDSDGDHLFVLSRLEQCWDSRLAEFFSNLAQQSKYSDKFALALLNAAVSNGSRSAFNCLMSFASGDIRGNKKLQKAVGAAAILLKRDPSTVWNLIWKRMGRSKRFGKALLEKYADDPQRWDEGQTIKNLSCKQVSDLFSWMVEVYPPSEDIDPKGVHSPVTREHVQRLRDGLLSDLRDRGTPESVEWLRTLRTTHPEISWISPIIVEAERQRLRSSWIPILPEQLAVLLGNSNARIINNEMGLQSAVMAALRSLNMELQGENAAVHDLWNEKGKPKKETHLSSYIARYLTRALAEYFVIVNREVEIRPGQHTDILVSALPFGDKTSTRRLDVVIEVKGSWHQELKTSMLDQLVLRYLNQYSTSYGIYLVGWYTCKFLTDTSKRKASPKWSIKEAQKFFEDQAAEVSQSTSTHIKSAIVDARVP